MKKLIILLTLPFVLIACHNQPTSFDDFENTSVYFSFQYPARTLVFGDYILPNESDENLEFSIGTQMGGVYSNDKTRMVELQLDESLVQNLTTANGDAILPLPEEYYSFTNVSGDPGQPFEITIPKGELNGYVDVQLNEQFLDDPLSYNTHYVIPLKITDTSLDSILTGEMALGVTSPNVHRAADWDVAPKHYVLYGVKYINPYHGNWFHRGYDLVEDLSGQPVDTVTYRTQFVTDNELWKLKTTGRNSIEVTAFLRRSNVGSPGDYDITLNFNEDNTVTVSEAAGTPYQVSGTGEFIADGGEFGGESRNAIHLNYQVQTNSTIHHIQDTLVLRDRAVKFETFQPVVVN